MLRVRLTGAQARSFAKRALDVVSAGRPPCPLCSLPARPGRTRMPAPERVPPGGLTPPVSTDTGAGAVELLAQGELTVRGRMREASNAVLYCSVAHDGREAHCVYKPVAGERPLWDFPDGTLAAREVAAYLVSEATGWGLVPPTVLRDGPYGEGMCQLWIEAVPDAPGCWPWSRSDEPGRGLEGGRRGRGRRGAHRAAGARRRRAAAAAGGARRGDQQRRPQGRPSAADRRRTAVRRSTTASPSTPTTSCAPCCGAGPASR